MKVQRNIAIMLLMTVLAVFSADAQLFKAFGSVGLTLAQMDGDEVYGFNRVGYSAGLGVMMPLNPNNPDYGFQASLELVASQRGAKEMTDNDPFIYKANMKYIDIPVMLHYVDRIGGLTFGLGLQYGRLIKSTESWTVPSTPIIGMDRPVDTSYHSFRKNDLSLVADVRFTIWRNFKFDFRYQYSLIPVREDFTFCNSYDVNDDYYNTWNRDFKHNYMTFKIIYVINEHYDVYKTKPNRQRR